VFGTAAYVDVEARHLDEGQMLAWGGGVAISLTPSFRTEFEIESGEITHAVSSDPTSADRFRQTSLTVSLGFEGGPSQKFRLIAGAGGGGLFQRWTARSREIRPGFFEALWAKTNVAVLYGRVGLVMEPRDRLVVRIEGVLWKGRESATVGLRGGVGWRL
jgi:hypothetical protein